MIDISRIRDSARITLTIETSELIELEHFVGAFTSMSDEYRRYIERSDYPKSEAKLYVAEVRRGSYVADLIPYIAYAAPFITVADQTMIMEQFLTTWKQRIQAILNNDFDRWNFGRNELKTFMNTTAAIARDPDASSKIEYATYEDGTRKVRAALQFDTRDAGIIQENARRRIAEMDNETSALRERVLMVFTRTDTGNAPIGKKSGEKVIIEEITEKPLALAYAPEVAEQQIKHEIRESEDNVYKKGFIVDVFVKTVKGKPSVYSISAVHQVLDIPEE